MNEKSTVTRPMPRRWQLWYCRKRFWLSGLLIAFTIYYFIPSVYDNNHVRFAVHHSGRPNLLTFVVRDSHGAPVPNITVSSLSTSGWAGGLDTDSQGIAIIDPGESEVLAVSISDQEFRFDKYPGLLQNVLVPDCAIWGLTFSVTLRALESKSLP